MSMDNFHPGIEFAHQLDINDELVSFREAFINTESDLIYMDGNSLGRLPKTVPERIRSAIDEEWGHDLIRGWNKNWYSSPVRVGEKIALLVGAAPGQVVVSDSTSVNLFKLVLAALSLHPERTRIISDTLNFPSDLYILQGCSRLLGGRHDIIRIGSNDGDITPDIESLYSSIDNNTALITLSQVAFKSGFLYDMAAVTARAHRHGALVLWDLSHSAGVIPIQLDTCDVDFAVGCTYKYLNGGPGSPAFLYVRKDLQDVTLSPIWGWFSQKSPFTFDLDYNPATGITRFLAGTPPILSLLTLESALNTIQEAGIVRLRRKSVLLTEYIVFLADTVLSPLGFSLGSPRDPERRGSHVSLRHPEGYRISRSLVEELNVLPDFREPDNIRFGLSPLYTSFTEVWQAVERTRRALEEKLYQKYPAKRLTVT